MDNREVASLIWLCAIATLTLCSAPARSSLRRLATLVVQPAIAFPLVLLVTYTCGLLWVASVPELWDWEALPAIMIWFLTSALVLFFRLDRALKQPRYFRGVLIESVGLFLLVQFYLNLFPLALIGELFLQGALIVLAIFGAAASLQKEHRALQSLALATQGLVLLVIAIHTLSQLVIGTDELDWIDLGKQFVLPVFLNVGLVPFLYALTLWAAYEKAFMQMKRARTEANSVWPGRFALITKAGLSIQRVHGLDPRARMRMSQSASVREAWKHYEDGTRDQIAAAAARSAAEHRLVVLAGVEGVDDQGLRLDQREFKETRAALEWLATCHMGHYRNKGEYRADMITLLGLSLGPQRGLPVNHGIEMNLSEDGQSWWAYRTTVSGWVFGIGASEAPPDQWKYDGPSVPGGPPESVVGWWHVLSLTSSPTNW